MEIMLMKIKDGMIVAAHIMATGIDLEIYSDITYIMLTKSGLGDMTKL